MLPILNFLKTKGRLKTDGLFVRLIFYFEHGLIIGEFALGAVKVVVVGGFAGFAAFLLPVLDLFFYPCYWIARFIFHFLESP